MKKFRRFQPSYEDSNWVLWAVVALMLTAVAVQYFYPIEVPYGR